MSIYQFAPDNTSNHNHSFVTWEDAFSNEELDRIVTYGDSLNLEPATVNSDTPNVPSIRRSMVGWIDNNPDSGWIYDRLAYVARKANAKFFGFDLYGFVEHFQYTVYTADDAGHYTWHEDMTPTTEAARKLSLVLQLSDPEDYDGGVLETLNGSDPVAVDKKRGLIALVPSWRLHRVTPVTRGIRKTLVVWTAGPSFK